MNPLRPLDAQAMRRISEPLNTTVQCGTQLKSNTHNLNWQNFIESPERKHQCGSRLRFFAHGNPRAVASAKVNHMLKRLDQSCYRTSERVGSNDAGSSLVKGHKPPKKIRKYLALGNGRAETLDYTSQQDTPRHLEIFLSFREIYANL